MEKTESYYDEEDAAEGEEEESEYDEEEESEQPRSHSVNKEEDLVVRSMSISKIKT